MNFTWIYVGVVYAIAVFLARRAGVGMPRRVALFFYAIVLVFFFRPMTQKYVNLPVDFIQEMSPWVHMLPRPTPSINSEINDLPLQIVPWAHQVRESWKSLEVPLWNNMNGAGYPLLANGQSSALSLVRLIAIPLPLGQAMTAEAAMKILIALTFTFLYCRGRGRSELASAIAAVTFGFSGFIISWLHFPLVTAACFAPAVLYCIDRLAERVTYGRIVFFASIWTAMLFAGHPETAGHLFWLTAVYSIWVLAVERIAGWRFAAALLGALAISALLAAPYLASVAEAIPKSRRYGELKQTRLSATNLPYTDLACAILVIQPQFWGQVPFDKAWGPAQTEPLGGYAGVFALAAWFAVFLNVLRERAWRSRELFFSLTTLFVFGAFMAWPFFGDAFHAMMPLAAHARLRLLFVLLLAIQSAYAIDLARRVPLLAGIAAVAGLLLLLLQIPLYYEYKFDTAVLAMFPGMLVLVIATVVALRRSEAAIMLLLVAITAELFIYGRDRNPTVPDSLMYPKTPLLEVLEQESAKQPANQPFRMTGLGPAFFPNVNVLYGQEDVRPHDPMANGAYMGFLVHTADYNAEPYFATWDSTYSSMLDYLNVKYVIAQPHLEIDDLEHMKIIYSGRDGKLLENMRVLPRFFPARNVILEFRDPQFAHLVEANTDWANTVLLEKLDIEDEQQRPDLFNPRPGNAPMAKVEIVEAGRSEYRLRTIAPRWTIIVSSIPWWRGWKVERYGQRVEPIRVNAVFLGFAVPPGETDVRVWYSPPTFWIGAWISLATVLGLVGYGVWGRRRVA